MRWHIPIIISVIIISLLIINVANAARRCTEVTEGDNTFSICFDVPDEPAPEPELEPGPEPVPEPEPVPMPEPEPEPLPPDMIIDVEIVSDREIVLEAITADQERVRFILELIEEKIGEDFIKKPRLNINLDIKNLARIPPRIDAKLTPYSYYAILTLSAASLLLILWIIKDIVEPKIRI